MVRQSSEVDRVLNSHRSNKQIEQKPKVEAGGQRQQVYCEGQTSIHGNKISLVANPDPEIKYTKPINETYQARKVINKVT